MILMYKFRFKERVFEFGMPFFFLGAPQVAIQLIWDHPEFGGYENGWAESADGRDVKGAGGGRMS